MNKLEIDYIITAYYEEIYLFCLRKVNYDEHLARDLLQDTFLLMLEHQDDLVNSNLRAWLYSVADKKVKEVYKKKKKNQSIQSFDYLSYEIPYNVDLFVLIENNLNDEKIEYFKEQVISCLTPAEKELYVKIYVEHIQYRAIATKFQISEKAVRLRAFRLRQKIKELSKILIETIYTAPH